MKVNWKRINLLFWLFMIGIVQPLITWEGLKAGILTLDNLPYVTIFYGAFCATMFILIDIALENCDK